MHVAGVFVPHVVALPEMLHELFPGPEPPRLLREQREETELRTGQLHRLAVDGHLVSPEVDRDAADAPDRRVALCLVELSAPDESADAAHELGKREGRRAQGRRDLDAAAFEELAATGRRTLGLGSTITLACEDENILWCLEIVGLRVSPAVGDAFAAVATRRASHALAA